MSAGLVAASMSSLMGNFNSQSKGMAATQQLLGIADKVGKLKTVQMQLSPGSAQYAAIDQQLQKLQQQEKMLTIAKEHANAMQLAYKTLDESNQKAIKDDFDLRKRLLAAGATFA